MTQSRSLTLLVTGLALFAMYFGAGNLIFPVMIGIESGPAVTSAITGFLMTGVLLPVLGMVAAATAPEGVEQIADRIGHHPGLVFTVIIFLSTGMLYAIPRVATVSYEMVLDPLVPSNAAAGWLAEPLFLLVFFAVTYVLAVNPKGMLDRIGGFLTPILLLFLFILIVTALIKLPLDMGPAGGEYADTPLATGLINGYFTMDAIASLVFGIVIIEALRRRGFETKNQLFTGTALAGVIAGIALALVYLGLAAVGSRLGTAGLSNGAEALAHASTILFGRSGQLIFGVIVLLACLTTAVGLTGASTQYFRGLFPAVPRVPMVVFHVAVAFALANLGLEAILQVVAPINQLIYPIVICIVFISILDIFVPGDLKWTYRLATWFGVAVGAFEALWSTQLPVFASLRGTLDAFPLGAVHMPWVAPALAGFVIGFIIDAAARNVLSRGLTTATA